ncbi:MAG: DUF4430 domain-containing protein [Oscillospiraceae bacterium]
MAFIIAVQTAFCYAAAASSGERGAAISGVFSLLSGGNSDADFLDGADSGSVWAPLCYIRLYGTDGAEGYAGRMLAAAEELVDRDGFVTPTELQRAAVVLSALGKCPRGLIDRAVYLNNDLDRQGFNAWLWALIAANCSGAEPPENAVNTRESITAHILSRQLADGGFALFGDKADADVTAAAIYALAPVSGNAEVSAAVSAAVECLSGMQLENGGFMSVGVENCESAAQAVIAFTAAGVKDERLEKAVGAVMSYRRGDGGFAHTFDGESNRVATVQALEALTALELSERGELLFDAPLPRDELAVGEGNGVENTPETSAAVGTGNTPETSAAVGAESNPETSAAVGAGNTPETNAPTFGGQDIKLIICVVCAAGALACAVLFAVKRRGGLLAAAVVLAVCGGGVWLLDIKTPEEYYGQEEQSGVAVTVSADCSAVLSRMGDIDEAVNPAEVIPADGVVIGQTEVSVAEGGTAFDALTAAARANGVRVDYTGSVYGVYINGIGFIYEFGFGSTSGWMYRVNGEFPDTSAGTFVLSEGDKVEFIYTCDMGNDIRR